MHHEDHTSMQPTSLQDMVNSGRASIDVRRVIGNRIGILG
jgi:hypothetical protein